jgi:phosphonate transport system substrate-binding protein
MPHAVRFALFAQPSSIAVRAFEELATHVAATSPLRLEPVWVPSYAALAEAIDRGAADVGWSPPLVARDLLAAHAGVPVVAVERRGHTSYFSVLVARQGFALADVRSLANARVGWVSKLSAAGYVIPSLYLQSLGIEPGEAFAEQSFFGSHARVGRALDLAEVDVAATYATIAPASRALLKSAHLPSGTRVLAAAGPIPGDVIFASTSLDPRASEGLRGSLLRMTVPNGSALRELMDVDRFEVPSLEHFDTLRRWRERAIASEPAFRAAQAVR